VKNTNSLALWNLRQDGRPRHIDFTIQLQDNFCATFSIEINSSKVIVGIHNLFETKYIYANRLSLQNATLPCTCVNRNETCRLAQQKITLPARSTSSWTPQAWVFFLGERYIIEYSGYSLHLRDTWQPVCRSTAFFNSICQVYADFCQGHVKILFILCLYCIRVELSLFKTLFGN
jgi:hypothetical protein